MVGIARNQHHIVELAEEGQLVGLEGKPHVDALLDDGHLALLANLAQVLVVEDDVVFDERVLKLALAVQQPFVVGVVHPIAAAEVVALGDVARGGRHPAHPGYLFPDECHQGTQIYVQVEVVAQGFVHLGVVTSVDKESNRLIGVVHGV